MWRQRGPGAPRRLKTYSAECGYVWEYFFAGRDGASYCFEASATRRAMATVRVEIDGPVLAAAAERDVTDVEEYAVAKMALLRAFDRWPPNELPAAVCPAADEFRDILRTLDLL